MASSNVFGVVRKMLQGIDKVSVGVNAQMSMTEQLEKIVAWGGSPWEEIVKMGAAFETHIVTANALAPVVAIPTTANMLSLWNGEPDGTGRSLIIDRVWGLLVVGIGTTGQSSLIGCLGQTRVAAPAVTVLAKNTLNGTGSNDTKVSTSIAVLDAVTGVAANWRLLPSQTGGVKAGAGTTPGTYINAEVNGRIIVPPGRLFAMHVFAETVTTQTFIGGIEWHEKVISLG